MNKSTKGALAAGSAAVLLLGGAGSLAFWTADGAAEGGSITAGDLKLTDGTCDTDWVYAAGSAGAGNPVDLFVPGDEITKQCTFGLQATGDNLTAKITAPASVSYTSTGSATALSLTADTTFTVDDLPLAAQAAPTPIANGGTVTSANDGDTVTATFLVRIPFGTDESGAPVLNGNDAQDLTATLDTLTVSLAQEAN
jgi:alternate signal-mediated exported protein